MEFVEVRGRTVEVAVAGALAELGLESEEQAEIEIITEGKKGFLGVGGEDAVVRVRPKPAPKKKRRRRRGKGGGSKTGDQSSDQDRSEAKVGSSGGRPGGNGSAGGGGRGTQQSSGGNGRGNHSDAREPEAKEPEAKEDVAGQAEAVDSFLNGLVTAFGIEGNVSVDVQKDIISATVDGDQTEALVGTKGVVMSAVQEVTRTVVQRRFHQPARVRLDIAGYNERRREALAIYAERLASQVLEDGGEIMLEPMNPADRKVVHDAIAAIDGVESYSEGEDPRRSVVISRTETAGRRDEEE